MQWVNNFNIRLLFLSTREVYCIRKDTLLLSGTLDPVCCHSGLCFYLLPGERVWLVSCLLASWRYVSEGRRSSLLSYTLNCLLLPWTRTLFHILLMIGIQFHISTFRRMLYSFRSPGRVNRCILWSARKYFPRPLLLRLLSRAQISDCKELSDSSLSQKFAKLSQPGAFIQVQEIT